MQGPKEFTMTVTIKTFTLRRYYGFLSMRNTTDILKALFGSNTSRATKNVCMATKGHWKIAVLSVGRAISSASGEDNAEDSRVRDARRKRLKTSRKRLKTSSKRPKTLKKRPRSLSNGSSIVRDRLRILHKS